ncbi:hypothetical protein DYL72_15255 [Vibrio anguillarum]|uniref:Uncharacterized protein n=1 Tax=Vibrio anguillarum TaxID=55601 RepID=A0A7U6FS16_VIBAN|nr:hypothetical protein [Vibrio anguillarum]AZS26264.1 hypothetical protein DYL72_15255 [Vibrio anguillarum]
MTVTCLGKGSEHLVIWAEKFGRSEKELIEGLSLYAQLTNLAFSKSRTKILSQLDTRFFTSNRVDVVLTKSLNSFQITLNAFDKYAEKAEVMQQYKAVIKAFNLPQTPKTNGILRAITFNQYRLLENIHYLLVELAPYFSFETRNINSDLMRHLALKDSLSNGLGVDSLNALATKLLTTNDLSFFEKGFMFDFFVHDRDALYTSKSKKGFIVCYKDRLSTWFFESKEKAIQQIDEYKTLFCL